MAEKRTIKAYVAADPERITTPEGKQFAAFPVVENKRYKDPETQEWKDAKATRYDVTVDQPKLRDNVLASLEKGQRVTVEGNYVAKPYSDSNGNQRIGRITGSRRCCRGTGHPAGRESEYERAGDRARELACMGAEPGPVPTTFTAVRGPWSASPPAVHTTTATGPRAGCRSGTVTGHGCKFGRRPRSRG